MFRKRLTVALAMLAAAAVLEGAVAIWALGVAERHVQRGRVASDIQLGFVELSATKQRLRSWVAQRQLDAQADPAQRDQLQADMRTTLARLHELSERAIELDDAHRPRAEHVARHDALAVLSRSLDDLERTVAQARPLRPGTDARAASAALSRLFDVSDGRDLRGLLADGMAREAEAVRRERAAADATLRAMRTMWLATAAALGVASLLLAAHFAQALRRPLDRLAHGARALQRGDLRHRIPAEGIDEFAEVARGVNAMAAELSEHREREALARHRLEELVHARTAELQGALEALQQVDARRRRLLADVSHELRTPTTAIRGEAEITLRGRDRSADEYKAALARIVEASRQLGLVIDDLLAVARSDIDALALERRPIDLAAPLAQALAQARALGSEREIEVSGEPPGEPLPVLGDAQRLRQLLMLLLDNAVRYSRPGGRVTTRVRRVASADGAAPRCEVEVVDEGIGIDRDELPRVFERTFRSEQARRHRADGIGLGLSIGAALARAHGGEIVLDSAPGRGTVATLRLPLIGHALADRGAR